MNLFCLMVQRGKEGKRCLVNLKDGFPLVLFHHARRFTSYFCEFNSGLDEAPVCAGAFFVGGKMQVILTEFLGK